MGRNNNIKNLSSVELGRIQTMLDNGSSPTEVGKEISRDPSGIRKEIKNYSHYSGQIKCSICLNKNNCKQHFLCNKIPNRKKCSSCKYCKHAPKKCFIFKTNINCKLLKKNHHVCNGCEIKNKCKKPHIIYHANRALLMHQTAQNISRKDLIADSLPQAFKDYISKRIKLGHSPEVILHTLPEEYKEYKMAVSTLYNSIDKGCFECCNIDLRNKELRVRYGTNTVRKNTIKSHHLNGRSIDDLSQEVKDNKPLGYHELDTVEGIKGGALLFTILIPIFSLLLAFKISSKTQTEIKRVLDELETKLKDNFYILFELGVPDNGAEFLDYDAIEHSIDYTEDYPLKRLSIFYTHVCASYEKPHVENAHTLLRWLIAKKVDITLLSDNDILSIINRLNNYPRAKLGFKTPLRALEEYLGSDVINILGLEHLPIDIVNMKDMILQSFDDIEN